MHKKLLYISIGILALILLLAGVLWLRSLISSSVAQTQGSFFGIGQNVSTVGTNGAGTNTTGSGTQALQKVFEIATGPVASATFIQTFAPTTTLARYAMADSGHILDYPLDVPGAVAQPVSNTTIPGIVAAQWAEKGGAGVLQYVDSGVMKSVYVELASTTATSTATAPARISFLPDAIVSLAISPGGQNVAYLMGTASGVDGYIAEADGDNAKKLFSLPLSQVTLSWPSENSLLVQEKSADGVPGIALSIDTKTGASAPLLYASGLSATANGDFSKVIYQTSPDTTTGAVTYAHDSATGKDTPMAGNPLPEKCAWSAMATSTLYCAEPLGALPPNYLDLWHQGLVQTADSILAFDTNTGIGTVITIPGQGGANAPIQQIIVSSDDAYLMFITRGDQSLWGVRLQ